MHIKTNRPFSRLFQGGAALAVLVGLVSGCATPQKPRAAVFFPAPPEKARLQFLTSYSGPEDFELPNRVLNFLIGTPTTRQPIVKPYGIAIADGKIYVCDTFLGKVHVLNLKNRRFSDLAPSRGSNIQKPVNIAVDKKGILYIADTLLGQVVMCKSDGTLMGTIGTKKASRLTDVAVEGDRLYVADMGKSRVYAFDKTTLKPVAVIPSDPTNKVEQLLKPTNIAVDGRNHVYVSDAGLFCVKEYDATGRHVQTFGRIGDAPGEFARPKGIALDRESRLYVADAASSVVQIFDSEGRLLMFFGEPGSGQGQLFLPASVIVDYDHIEMFRDYIAPGFEVQYLVLVTSQYGPRKISVYGFGHQK